MNAKYKKIIPFLFLLSSTAYSMDSSNEAEAPSSMDRSNIAVGGIYGTSKGITLGDYALFDPTKTSFYYYRYGGGTPRLQLGNGIGISVASTNGALIAKDGIVVVGLEPVSGGFVLNTNNLNIENYYQWSPALTMGTLLKMGKSSFLLVGRGGASVGNHGYDGLGPRFRSARGASLYFNSPIENASFNYTLSGDGYYTENIDLQNHYFDIRLEKDKGKYEETSVEILFKIY